MLAKSNRNELSKKKKTKKPQHSTIKIFEIRLSKRKKKTKITGLWTTVSSFKLGYIGVVIDSIFCARYRFQKKKKIMINLEV